MSKSKEVNGSIKELDLTTEPKLPNKTTLSAMEELEHGSPQVYGSVEEMFLDVNK